MSSVLANATLERLWRSMPCYCCVALLGCGATDNVRADRPEPADDVAIKSTINSCPTFAFYLVLPKQILPGEIATVTALATDLDSDDTKLTYVWSASSGEISKPTSPLTEYTCADSGPQVLRVTTSDPDGCESVLDLDVDCMAP